VADFFTLREFDGLTGEQRSVERHWLGLSGNIIGLFTTVSMDGNNLVLSSWLENEVQVWNPETHEELEIYHDFAAPLNAIRFQGDLVVAELGSNSVVRASVTNPAERVTLASGLGVPVGLAATDDDLWVSDAAAGSVLQIVANGESLAEPVLIAKDLASPEGLVVTPDGNLLVVEAKAGRLSSIDLGTGNVSTIAEELELGWKSDHPTWLFNGVAVGQSGTIYVTGDITNVLYRIEPNEGGK
jgi:DNA-binding beta-propeller fold protein YncE